MPALSWDKIYNVFILSIPAMLGLYVHIPFCARRCPYCDFAILPNAGAELVDEYVAALCKELYVTLRTAHRDYPIRELTSIFFGGGTPSYLAEEQLARVLEIILNGFPVAEDAEITLEANPEDATLEKLRALKKAGWNRISFGAQSFLVEELKLLGRRHHEGDIESAVRLSREAGFENISLDLIYATPSQTTQQWRSSLQQAVALNVEHISCYSLTIESGTNFGRRAARGALLPMADDDQAEMMQLAETVLTKAGFERYEISNYARPGFRSRHNENYWRGGDYLACGNSAHGHHAGVRWWNERDTRKYIALIREKDNARTGEEHLQPRQRLDELVMLGLRTSEGFNLDEVARLTGVNARQALYGPLETLLEKGLLESRDGFIRLSPVARPVADAVAVRLLE